MVHVVTRGRRPAVFYGSSNNRGLFPGGLRWEEQALGPSTRSPSHDFDENNVWVAAGIIHSFFIRPNNSAADVTVTIYDAFVDEDEPEAAPKPATYFAGLTSTINGGSLLDNGTRFTVSTSGYNFPDMEYFWGEISGATPSDLNGVWPMRWVSHDEAEIVGYRASAVPSAGTFEWASAQGSGREIVGLCRCDCASPNTYGLTSVIGRSGVVDSLIHPRHTASNIETLFTNPKKVWETVIPGDGNARHFEPEAICRTGMIVKIIAAATPNTAYRITMMYTPTIPAEERRRYAERSVLDSIGKGRSPAAALV